MIYLVHHAEAVAADVDAQRPISDAGRAHAQQLAAAAVARGVKPAAIWHSGKLRARQTADAFWRAANPLAEFCAIRGLQPDDPPDVVAAALAAEDRDVMLVGHMPHLDRLHAHLLSGSRTAERQTFPPHGLVALEWDGKIWREAWRLAG